MRTQSPPPAQNACPVRSDGGDRLHAEDPAFGARYGAEERGPTGDEPCAWTTDAAGCVHAQAHRFLARFEPGATTFAAAATDDGGAPPQVQLRFLRALRNGVLVASNRDARPERITGGQVHFAHDGLTEVLEPRDAGLEQAFDLASAPAGHGDLVLQIQVVTDLTAAPCAARHGDLAFARDGVPVIRYGAAYGIDRSGQVHALATALDATGLLELIVPERFVDEAAYPVRIDPLLSPELLPGASGHAGRVEWGQATAYDPITDRYLVAWASRAIGVGSQTAIRGELFYPDGTSVTGSYFTISAADGDLGMPTVAGCERSGQGSFFVVWRKDRGLVGRLIGPSGQALGAQLTITATPSDTDDAPCLAGPGRGGPMMLVFQRSPAASVAADRVMLRSVFWNGTTPSLSPETTVWSTTSGHVRRPRIAGSCASLGLAGRTVYANRIVWDQWFPVPAPGDYDVITRSLLVADNPYSATFLEWFTPVQGASQMGVDEHGGDIAARAPDFASGAAMDFCITWQESGGLHRNLYGLTTGALATDLTVDPGPGIQDSSVSAGSCQFLMLATKQTPYATTPTLRYFVGYDGDPMAYPDNLGEASRPRASRPMAASHPAAAAGAAPSNHTLIAYGVDNRIAGRMYDSTLHSFVGGANTGCPGPNGVVPFAATAGGTPWSGNGNFRISLQAAPPWSLATLYVDASPGSFAPPPLTPIPGAPGCTMLASGTMLGWTVTNIIGSGSIAMPVPCMPTFVSGRADYQWIIAAPGANPAELISTGLLVELAGGSR